MVPIHWVSTGYSGWSSYCTQYETQRTPSVTFGIPNLGADLCPPPRNTTELVRLKLPPPPPSLPGPGPPCPRPDIGHLDFPALARGGRLEGCTVAELKEFCRQKALLRSGKKADLILRIEAGGFLRGVHEPPIGMSSTATVFCTWVVPPSLCSRGLLKTNFLHGGGRVGLEFGLPYTGGVPSF